MEAEGATGKITVTEGLVTIRRRKLLGSTDDTRSIRVDEIAGVDFRRASAWESGYIKLVTKGSSGSSDLTPKAYDREAVSFRLDQQSAFLTVRAALMERITGEPFVDTEAPTEMGRGCAIALLGAVILFVGWFLYVTLSA
ncbi:DUF4429 domain-containing protein [Sphingomonas sp. 3-13AW]|uniref:DUF4429 domain-containing protein n=1 Tax=Sphingomonas sp. 3-13AW TaxID=3050450 RepID=UPI003BB7F46B